ncbi:MAG: hypothetical protein JWO38_7381 [Gemmataceae bacterium]|nr:hypothetical protein [Gemmataceae bacterium]
MTPLPIPVPPMLEQAVGVPDAPARYVGLYWGEGDELYFTDGRTSGTGHGYAFLLYRRHPAVEPSLAGYHIGACDQPADHWLVLDRQARRLAVAPVAMARDLLRGQWPPSDPATLSEADWRAIVDHLRSRPVPTMEQLFAALQEQRQVEKELVTWLDSNRPGTEGDK